MSSRVVDAATSRPRDQLSEDTGRLVNQYRVAAFPADYAITNDVILCDQSGRAYLLSQTEEQPLPLEADLANSLGMFFEPSQDSSWHTATELRRMIYGVSDDALPLA